MIYQYNEKLELIGNYETLAKAKEATGLGLSTIHDSISGKHRGRHGFTFTKEPLGGIQVDFSDFKKTWDKIEKEYTENVSKTETDEGEYVTDVTSDAFKEYCVNEGIDINKVKSAKYVNHQGQKAFNVVLDYNKEIDEVLTEDFITSIINKNFEPLEPVVLNVVNNSLLRIIITDVHIGMNTNEDGNGLYGGKWDKDELMNRLNILIQNIEIYEQFYKEIHIIDLGDYLDGWNAETVRKGHHLPQNMSNEEAFASGLEFKMKLLNYVSSRFEIVNMHNICNDNHSGDFGAIVNHSVKVLAENTLRNVRVFNHKKFINHYKWNNHTFMLSHGKDDKHLKFGFKPQIDMKGISKIEEYMKINNLMNRDNNIIFEKGDSHQQLFDYDCSDDFNYFNYRAFSPSSEWVQTNFKRGVSGFTIMQIIDERVTTTPITFKWNK